MENITFLKKSRHHFITACFLFLTAVIIIMPGYNKFWAPYDEGFILEASYMAEKGMVPYRDFFILMYPPGQIYIIAMLFKIFGLNFIMPRVFTALIQVIICICVFYIIRKLAPQLFAILGFVICLNVLAINGGSIPRPIWPAIAFSLLSMQNLVDFIMAKNRKYLLIAGFFAGLALIFRHDIGTLTIIAAVFGLLLFALFLNEDMPDKSRNRIGIFLAHILIYIAIPIIFVALILFWLYKVNAVGDAFKSLILFPKEFVKGGAIPFPAFCYDFSMIFHRGCLFIKRNCYYIPIVIILVTALLLIEKILERKKMDKRILAIIIWFVLCVFYLQQVLVRTDTAHLAMSFPPVSILFALMLNIKLGYRHLLIKTIDISLITFSSLLVLLFFYINTELYFKDIYRKPFIQKTIKPVSFNHGTVYIPDDGREVFLSLVDYVRRNTKEDEKIYIGNLNHSVPQYGWFELIYFLTGRMPAVKYYEIHPGLQDKISIQKEMIQDLRNNNTNVLLLRDYKTDYAPLGPLDKYIREEYKLDIRIDSYHIYVKK